jgi:hypothetical protein
VVLSSFALAWSACTDEGEEAGSNEFRSLDDGLELHWSFEDRVGNQITDLSGNGRHGTLTGGGSFVASPVGEAVSLDGVDDYIALTHLGLRAPSLYGGVTGDFTISARVKVTNSSKLNTLCFGCGPMSSMYAGTATYPGKLMSAVFNQQSGGLLWPLSTTALPNDEWREVTLVVDGGVSARYYVDCVADGQMQNANIGLKDYNFSAVGQGSAADRWYGGQIDELRVWSRALPEAELAELCQQAPPPPPPPPGPKLHWTFEDHSGNQITDVSGNGYHGTLNGGTFVNSPKGQSISLDGINDYVSFTGPRAPALYGGVSGDFTISARVKVTDLAKFNTLSFGAGPSATWFLGDTSFPGRMTASFLNQSNNGTMWTASTPALTEDTWTQVTMVVDGGVSVRHYFDCALNSQVLSANIGLKDFGSSSVGYSANAARWFGGEIDELRIWDRAVPDSELSALCPACDQPILVDVDAPNGGDGKTWATAFNNLQDAIDAGEACESPEIWVAEGTYAPSDNTVPVATISEPLSIYGGFAGTETLLAERDFVAHPVRLGADGWQSRVVVIEDPAINFDTITRLDGLTISGSQAGAIDIAGRVSSYQPEPVVLFHNLVITDNSATKGAGIDAHSWSLTFEIVNSHFEGNVVTERGAALDYDYARVIVDNSTFIANNGPKGAIYDLSDEIMDLSTLLITNSTLSGNIGGAFHGERLYATDCEFSNNTGRRAITIEKYEMEIDGCTFTNNQSGAIVLVPWKDEYDYEIVNSTFSGNVASHGGAISILGGDTILITGNEFNNNASTSGKGGAIYIGLPAEFGPVQTTLDGNSFVGNTAGGGGGGALYLVEGITTIENSTFVDNTAAYGGAMQVDSTNDELVIRDSRFVSNDALGSTGGALRNLAPNVSVINTEFVGNTSVSHGGGFYGRATFTSTTFANNVAGGTGNGLFAPGGPSMTMRNVTAWPDNLSAASMVLDHSCIPLVTQTHTNNGTVFIAASPFAPSDIDLDGLTEYYLTPGSACVNIGGTVGEFDWTVLTTQASQCTDSNPVDAGVHYTPQSAVGPC